MKIILNCGLILAFCFSFSACKESLSPATQPQKPTINIVDADDSNFQQFVDKATTPVLIDVWAKWCAPCRMIKPVVEQAAADYAGKLLVVRIDDDKAPELAKRFTQSLPTLVVLNQACPRPAIAEGYQSDQQTRDFIAAAISGCTDGKPAPAVDRDSGAGLFLLRQSLTAIYTGLHNPTTAQVQAAFDVYLRKGLPKKPTRKQLAGAVADMTMADVTLTDPLVVAAVAPGSPAQHAGIVAGDKIVAMDGISVYGRPFMSVTNSLSGTRNSILKLSIEHDEGSSVERKEVSLQRAKVSGFFD